MSVPGFQNTLERENTAKVLDRWWCTDIQGTNEFAPCAQPYSTAVNGPSAGGTWIVKQGKCFVHGSSLQGRVGVVEARALHGDVIFDSGDCHCTGSTTGGLRR